MESKKEEIRESARKYHRMNQILSPVINGIRVYYKNDHALRMAFLYRKGNGIAVTMDQFEHCKKLGIIDGY